jgi:uncharacterized protein
MAVPGDVLPFREFVLKVHSRCDLACDHCYVYEHADQSWRGRPRVIAHETLAKAAERIAEHARQHHLAAVRVVLHGGEPLLAGAPGLTRIARTLRATIEPACAVDLRIHTNGVRLNEEFCELFLAERIKVGVSLDGDQAANDRHRRFADGRSSYARVIRAIGLLRQERYQECYAGLLCTVDVRSDPAAVYRALADLNPPAVDFLLPHATWDAPPTHAAVGRTPYADWLAAAFGVWDADGRRVRVRTFDSIIATTLGGASQTEALGLQASELLVIETDGSIEQADSLKAAYDGAPATGLNVFTHPLSEAALHPGIRARRQGLSGLSKTCRHCSVVTSCGGGLYAHRYRTGAGFDNPSVYCADLEKIITHVRARLPPAATTVQRRPAHQLRGEQFDALSAGLGDADAVGQLIRGQRSVQRALLELLRERATSRGDEAFMAGWDLLAEVQRYDAGAYDQVSAHPYLRTWAEGCLRGTLGAGANMTGTGSLPACAAHLAAFAAAAAIRAGLPAEIDIPVMDGYACLPTLGRLRVGSGPATIAVGDDGFEVHTATGKWRVRSVAAEPDADWQPVRQLRSGSFAVQLEDTDPYRDCHQWPAADRLSARDVDSWQRRFAVAWPLIERAFPGYLPSLTSGLSTILPLAGNTPGHELSASSRQAFGAIGAALPADGDTTALLILHEFQHVKLGALLDLFDLCDPAADRKLFYAPWRDDPRPVEPLLQGAYAHLAVTDYWRVRRHELPDAGALAATERFALWRALTAEAIETIAGSGALTALGTRFVAGMSATVEPWLDEPVPEAAAATARTWAAERRARWKRRQQT